MSELITYPAISCYNRFGMHTLAELSSKKTRLKPHMVYGIQIVLLCLLYVATARFGLAISAANKFAALIWPPTGIALAALLIFGSRLWPALFLGALIANLLTGAPFTVACGIAVGNTLEAIVGTYLCRRSSYFDNSLSNLNGTLRLIIYAAAVSTLISATLGVGSLWLGGVLTTPQLQMTWLQWWVGDAMGDLTFAPLLLLFGATVQKSRNFFRRREVPEILLLIASLFGIGWLVLSGSFASTLAEYMGLRGIYVLMPLMLWASMRFGQHGSVLATFIISSIAIWSTSQGSGPFSLGAYESNLVHLMMFVFVIALTGLIVGSVVTDSERAKEAAESANAAKSAFLANMSHEIRTPLAAVIGFSELMANPELTVGERAKYNEIIKRNGQLLSGIINDILDLSKVEAGKIDIEKVAVPFAEVTAAISALKSLVAPGKSLELSLVVESPVPAFIQTDLLRLRQILLNVVGNAIKFTERGSVSVVVKFIKAGDDAGKLAFFVKDTGRGISKEEAKILFAPFSQADPSITRKFGGTGLGLILSKRLAEALGGDVILSESLPGIGSTFLITIDAGDAALSAQTEANVHPLHAGVLAAPSELEIDGLGPLKILVVDDSVDNQILIRQLLRKSLVTVETANTGKEGLLKALSGSFDIVFMDLQMPEMDGYQVIQELRAQGYLKPVLALTAHAMEEDKRKTLRAGFHDHITKPVDRNVFIAMLERYGRSAP